MTPYPCFRTDRGAPRPVTSTTLDQSRRDWIIGALLLAAIALGGCASGLGTSSAPANYGPQLKTPRMANDYLEHAKPVPPTQMIELELGFATHNQPQLDALMRSIQDPKSPNYQHWLTPAEMHARFGESEAQFKAVVDWLQASGFTIVDQGYGGNEDYIRFKGTVAQIEQALHVEMVSPEYQVFTNKQDPSIPPQFAGVIASITGLSGRIM